jgi:hypothetical protein
MALRGRQESRLVPAAPKAPSEKRPPASFSHGSVSAARLSGAGAGTRGAVLALFGELLANALAF